MTDANLGHQQSGTSYLVNVSSCPRHSQIPSGRSGGLGVAAAGTKWGVHSVGESGEWQNMVKCDQGGIVRCDY